MNSAETLGDVDDFLEYAYGASNASVWGAQRAADGHVAPYRRFAIEIGNEQDHTDRAYISQVVAFAGALAASARRLELDFPITVAIGVTPGQWPPSSILPLAEALSDHSLAPLDLLIDFHINGDAPATDPRAAFDFIASVAAVIANASLPIRGAVLEENGGRHDMQRALGHARNSNRLHCLGNFVRIDTAANGLQVVGRNDNSWDQGALFITQNGTFLAPHGMANVVLSAASASSVVAVEAAGLATAPTLDVIAVYDSSRTVLTVRTINFGATTVPANISLMSCTLAAPNLRAHVVMLNASSPTATNYPWDPLVVAPRNSSMVIPASGTFAFDFPPYSITSISVQCTSTSRRLIQNSLPVRSSRDAPTTCDSPRSGPSNFSTLGHDFLYYNDGPWQVTPSVLTLLCNSGACYDEAITVDAPLQTAGIASVSVSFAPQNAQGDDDAGLLLRCGIAGVGPGTDSFSCYEASLGPNQGTDPGSGFVLLGAHWLPSGFQLRKVPWDVPTNVQHTLSVQLASLANMVNFTISVNGMLAMSFNDTTYAGVITGGHVGLRSFYADAAFSSLTIDRRAA